MPNLIATGQLTLTDLNDAIISGTAPTNPSVGTLWIYEDTSVTPTKRMLKKWNGTTWDDMGELDPNLSETIGDIQETLGNMANDNLLDYEERQVIKDRLTDIIGYIIADTATTLPTTATNDAGTSGKGSFYFVRKNAQMAGLSTSDARYIKVATEYDALKTYLEALTPIDAWDLRDANKATNITVVKATFRDKWLKYYTAEQDLANATADQLKKNVDNVTVGGTNYASNGDFSFDITKSLWSSSYTGQVKEVLDISTEKPPFKYALHVKNTTNANAGIFTPTLWEGASAEAMVNKEITVTFWAKYSGVVQGASSWNLGRFGELVVEGETSGGAKVYRYPRASNVNADSTNQTSSESYYFSGTDTTWKKYVVTHKLSLPATATKLTKISLKHGLESCVGEFWTTGLKVEIGNKATDWTDSPYDVQGRLTSVEFKVTPDQIWSSLSSVEQFNATMNSKADMADFTFENGSTMWRNDHALTQPLGGSIVVSGVGAYGSNVLQFTGSTKYAYYGKMIPINPNNVYKVKFRVRQTVDPTTAGTSKVYAGVAGFDINKQPLTTSNYGSHRYCAIASKDALVADGWVEYTGTISGEGDEGFNQFITGTKYIVPMFIVNYSGGTGTAQVDICSVEDITEIDSVATRLDTVEQSITPSGITTVIQSSTFYENYQSEMGSKADTNVLGEYAKTTDVNTAIGNIDVEGQVETALTDMSQDENSVLSTTFATKLELEETSTNITSKFSATGGMNLLKNSIGFAGFNFWTTVAPLNISTISNQELDVLGFGSGFQFKADSVNWSRVEQQVNVVINEPYTISWYIKKQGLDGAWIQISEDGTNFTSLHTYADTYATTGYESGFVSFTPTKPQVTVRFMSQDNATFTGLMMSIGDVALQWSLATGENYNTNVRLDINGIRVSQLNADRKEIGFTQITPDEFAGYYDADGDGIFEKVFYLNGDETVTKKLKALNEITMGTIKIIKVEAGGNMGWAFVPITEE